MLDSAWVEVQDCLTWGWWAMAIGRLAREVAFDQRDIDRMTEAYEGVLRVLHLTERTDPIAEIVATKVVELFRSGVHEVDPLIIRVMQELGKLSMG